MGANETRYYVDVERLDAVDGKRYVVFGPFSDLQMAEECLIALAGRADVLKAQIRSPGGPR
jgi:hypothetical protein